MPLFTKVYILKLTIIAGTQCLTHCANKPSLKFLLCNVAPETSGQFIWIKMDTAN